MRLLDDIINKEVLDSHANILGTVKDVEINSSTMMIESLIVSKEDNKGGFTGRLSNNSSEDKVPFSEIGSVGDKIILKESLNEILNI